MKRQTIIESIIWIIVIFAIIFLYSCGSRKVESEKSEEIVIENNYSEGSKIVLGNSFTYTPFDALKPMKIEGKVYENAIVSNDRSVTKESYKNFNVYHHFNIFSKNKTEKSDNTILYVLIAFIICSFIFLWFYLPKIKSIK